MRISLFSFLLLLAVSCQKVGEPVWKCCTKRYQWQTNEDFSQNSYSNLPDSNFVLDQASEVKKYNFISDTLLLDRNNFRFLIENTSCKQYELAIW